MAEAVTWRPDMGIPPPPDAEPATWTADLGIPPPPDVKTGVVGNVNAVLGAARKALQPAANNLSQLNAPGAVLGAIGGTFAAPGIGTVLGAVGGGALGSYLSGARDLFSPPSAFRGTPPTPGGQIAADVINPMPENVAQAGMQAGTVLFPPVMGSAMLGRIVGAALGRQAGGMLQGEAPEETGKASVVAGGATGAVEGALRGVGAGLRGLPYIKGVLNERNARQLAQIAGEVNPAAGPAISSQVVQPTLKGGATMAQMRQAVTGGDLQDAASQRMDAAVAQVDALAGSPNYPPSGAIGAAYGALPQIVRDEVIGPVGTSGFTLPQAIEIRAYLGSKAFAQSPMGQGVTPVAQQRLWGRVTQEIEAALPPQAAEAWQSANKEYGGLQTIMDWLSSTNAPQGLPNRIMMNRSSLSSYLDANREDIVRRLGQQGYDEIVQRVLAGGQPGTVDRLATGGGGPLEAALQVFGRGRGGSPQLLGVPLRTGLPNIGSEYTGRPALMAPEGLRALMDFMAQRGAAGAMVPRQPPPVRPIPVSQ